MDLPQITDEQMQAGLRANREYSLLILKAGPNRQMQGVDAIVWEHGRRNFALRAAGLLSIVCPVPDNSDLSGIGIFNVDLAQLREIMDGDPGVQGGVFTYELHPCRSFPGDRLPD
jgi:hypothetical protein